MSNNEQELTTTKCPRCGNPVCSCGSLYAKRMGIAEVIPVLLAEIRRKEARLKIAVEALVNLATPGYMRKMVEAALEKIEEAKV